MTATIILALAVQMTATNWAALPALPYRAPPVVTRPMHDFVAREARARRCPLPPKSGAQQSLTVELAVLVDGSGGVRTVVPRAIRCPTVEQYAAGLAATFARTNILSRTGEGAQWYRTSLTFAWRQ